MVRIGFAVAALLAASGMSFAQTAPVQLDWRRLGNTSLDGSLASVASGPVDRTWYSADGARLFVRTSSGATFETADFETWTSSTATPPVDTMQRVPVAGDSALVRAQAGSPVRYAVGNAAYRSEDDGRSWKNLTQFRGQSLVGDGLTDLAISPRDPDELAVAGRFGLWRSLDGGLSWSGLNEGLPNLPLRRILRLPANSGAARIELNAGGVAMEAEWAPGQRTAWAIVPATTTERQRELRASLSQRLGSPILAAVQASDFTYAGGNGGRFWVSADRGASWRPSTLADAGSVESFWVNLANPRVALAALSTATPDGRTVRIARTINGGLFWDDLSLDLPAGSAYGVTADVRTGAIYAATATGVFLTYGDLIGAGPATSWTRLGGRLPNGVVRDVRLDESGNQLWAAVEGYGVFAALAPHRFREPTIVSAADLSARPAAPGGLLSVLGARVASARTGDVEVPVLAAGDTESQIQVPFGASGTSLNLALMAAAADGSLTRRDFALALRATSPSIFLDRDGTPMILDADRGVLLDAGTPARAGSRVQILATGLGRVTPDWMTGLPAPLDNPPRVVASVRAFLDRTPIEVTQATLAPGYIGFYVIEVQLPDVVNIGPAELFLEVGGQPSDRVSLQLTQ